MVGLWCETRPFPIPNQQLPQPKDHRAGSGYQEQPLFFFSPKGGKHADMQPFLSEVSGKLQTLVRLSVLNDTDEIIRRSEEDLMSTSSL